MNVSGQLICAMYSSCPGRPHKRASTLARVQPSLVFHLQVTHFGAMDAQQNLPRLPRYVKFRVLIIGRANAGKTTILQRVCNTTESPVIYRYDRSAGTHEQVCPLS
jgi:hypothetical protein